MATFLNPELSILYSHSGVIVTQKATVPLTLYQLILKVKSDNEKCSGIYENFSKSLSIDIPLNNKYSGSKTPFPITILTSEFVDLKSVIPELIEFETGKYWLLCNSPSEKNFVLRLEQHLGSLKAEIKCATIDQYSKNYLQLFKFLFSN